MSEGVRNAATILEGSRNRIAAYLPARRDGGRSAASLESSTAKSARWGQLAIDHGTNVGRPLPQGGVCARSRRCQWVHRHRLRTAGKGLASLSPCHKGKETMNKQRLPKGWTQEKIRKLAEHHDNLTEDEQAAEI